MAASATLATKQGKVLVASPRSEYRANIIGKLASSGGHASAAVGGADALLKLERGDFQTLLLDPQLEDLDAQELVETVRTQYPALNVVLLGAIGETAEQMSFELSDSEAELEATCGVEAAPVSVRPESATQRDARTEPLPGMIGTSRKMEQIYRLSRLVAPRDTTVLIVGATGTGKELVARGIHDLSKRSRGPFVVVNCAAIPESLLEAELFGFTRGAFTGAFQSRLGRIHAAHGGTLLLDEVGELPLGMQAKLLRFVQEHEVQRLGTADVFRVDARLIASTNADLLQRVREKQFREDLYYRLSVFPVDLPPLRERTGDTLPLAQHFLDGFCRSSGVTPKVFSPEAASLLQRYHWPGNVRELQHSVERAFVLAEDNPWIHVENLAMLTGAPDLTKF